MVKTISIKYLALTVVLAFVVATSTYYGSWPQDYESWTADKKIQYLWNKINEDHSVGAFPGFLGMMKLAAPTAVGGLDLWSPGSHVSDQFISGRPKAIHSVGMVGKAKFNWDRAAVAKLGLTGAFTESNDLIIRMSSGTDPTMGAVPNIALKHVRNGKPSGNLFFGHGLKAQDTKNPFQNPLANHVPSRHGGFSKDGAEAALFNMVFTKGPEYHGITSVAEFGHHNSAGKEFNPIKVPFTLIINPKPELTAECKDVPLDGQNFGCLKDLKVGRVLYTVFGVMDPKENVTQADVHYLGELQLTGKFVSSKFGDEQLFFKHVFQPEEVLLMKNNWSSKYNPGKFMDSEGPEKYRPFINGKGATHRRRRLH